MLKIIVKDYGTYIIYIYTFYQLSYVFIILADDLSKRKIGYYSLQSEKFKRIKDLAFKDVKS